MKKHKIWIPVTAVVLALAAIAAMVVVPRLPKTEVAVYPVNMVGYTDFYGSVNESYGMVTTDKVQTLYVSSTQTVTEILVYPGQEVKKGDVLFTYDTTLSDITLMKKDLAVQQAKLDLETAKKELKVINSYKPIRYYEVETPEPTEPAEPVADLSTFDLEGKEYLAYSGSGATSLTPKYCWLKSDASKT